MVEVDLPQQISLDGKRVMRWMCGEGIRYCEDRVNTIFFGEFEVAFDLIRLQVAFADFGFDQACPNALPCFQDDQSIGPISL
ncbi:MAG: hypothetical protein CMM61_02305 [Rhodospirillaceae bacterium]|nr:hypothetical protein [Rhodospirillaceae bacterium]